MPKFKNANMNRPTGHEVCSACSTISFKDLMHGFHHPWTYRKQLKSAKICPLCRLFVWSFSKLQLSDPSRVDLDYNAWIPQLYLTPYVARQARLNFGCEESMLSPPKHLSWIPHTRASETAPLLGSVNDGYSIQVDVPECNCCLHRSCHATKRLMFDQGRHIQIALPPLETWIRRDLSAIFDAFVIGWKSA